MAIEIGMGPVQPRGFIRRLPDDLSVTAAAKVLGGPALSNHGKASLSPAPRVEKAFGVKMDTLLRLLARYHTHHMRQRKGSVRVPPYTPI